MTTQTDDAERDTGTPGSLGAKAEVEATLTADAQVHRPLMGAAQIRMTGVDAAGRPVRISHAIGKARADQVDEAVARLRTGTPVKARGEWVRSMDGVATMRSERTHERPMPGEKPGPELAALEPWGPRATDRKKAKEKRPPSVVRQGLAQIVGSAMSHGHHDSEPEHLAALQKHASTFIGAVRGAGGVARNAYDRAVKAAEEKAGKAADAKGFAGAARPARPARDRGREL